MCRAAFTREMTLKVQYYGRAVLAGIVAGTALFLVLSLIGNNQDDLGSAWSNLVAMALIGALGASAIAHLHARAAQHLSDRCDRARQIRIISEQEKPQ